MLPDSLTPSDHLALVWLFSCNIAAFLVFGWDKWRASREGRRVRETTLVLLGAIGGWFGGFAAMVAFRHKTAKPSFQIKYALALPVFSGLVYLYLALSGRIG